MFHSATTTSEDQIKLECYFDTFRANIIGAGQSFRTPFGIKKIVYADWTASGRCYQPIEAALQKFVLPFTGNTHSQSTITGSLMSEGYRKAKKIIKRHIHAGKDDVLVFCGSGMTAAVNKLQRLLGLRLHASALNGTYGSSWQPETELKPVVFISSMEHHSNHTSWLETIADVEIVPCDKEGNIDLAYFKKLLDLFKDRKLKIAAITACSNVTGIETPYYAIARMIHKHGGLCFVDFACSAPYVSMDMHPGDALEQLDAIYFSPHKFLGGPGSPGVLVFNTAIYSNAVPDQPGGGTISYSNPWHEHDYIPCIEEREDGGTPPILQGIKAAMSIVLKEQMGIEEMRLREQEMLTLIFNRFSTMKNITLLEEHYRNRLGIFSFIVQDAHYNLVIRLLNDRFGIQARGGCSCAGTYGHTLLNVDRESSYLIRQAIHRGDLQMKPGWVRFSIHPVMTNQEIHYIIDAIEQVVQHYDEWSEDYQYKASSNEYLHKKESAFVQDSIHRWFEI